MSVPEVLAAWMQPFAVSFTTAVWRHVLVLVAGVVLVPGRRTVTAALRVMGLDQEAGVAVYHPGLSLGRWSSRAVAHRLLLLLVAALVPAGAGAGRPRPNQPPGPGGQRQRRRGFLGVRSV